MASQLPEYSRQILEKRYLLRNEQGEVIETPDELFRRVAKAVSQGDRDREEEYYNLMTNLDFLPNSPTLMNAGSPHGGTLSACFVAQIDDSMIDGENSIMQSAMTWAAVQKFGGGVGASFSRLRPKGTPIKTTHGTACGPIAVLKHYSSITDMITQGGKRSGANMGVMRVDHPDIIEFIMCKNADKEIKNFNISVAITDAFMEAVKKDAEYDLIDPHNGKPLKQIKAKMVFDLIVQQAHKNGEPGIIFIDKMNKYNPTPSVGNIEATNPCGEQPLLAYESCNLGSINLSNMIITNAGEVEVDWEKMKRVISSAVRFLDSIIDINIYPMKKIEDTTKSNRKIGLGVMGFADMLVKIGIGYNTPEAVNLAEEIMSFVYKASKDISKILADEKGSFPNYEKSVWKKKYKKGAVRNATTTTIAPTGTIGLIAGVSQGIEPLFRVAQRRRTGDIINPEEVQEGLPPKYQQFVIVNKLFEKIAKERGFYTEELLEKLYTVESIQNLTEIPVDVRKLFVTAYDVDPEWHIRIQSAFQKWTDNAVSKTVNFPFSATASEISRTFWLAYETNCKGLTIYRDKSRADQIVTKVNEEERQIQTGAHKKRPTKTRTHGYRDKIMTGCGPLYVGVFESEDGLEEIFGNMGQAGGCTVCFLTALGRIISTSLKSGSDPKDMMEQLRGNKCPREYGMGSNKVLSCADGIGIAIQNYLIEKGLMERPLSYDNGNSEVIKVEEGTKPGGNNFKINHPGLCPICGSPLEYQTKCPQCLVCGWSEC